MQNTDISNRSSLGLLDLTVDLSSPEIYSNEEFTVYLKIKNPFDIPIWIKEVSVSLPSKMYWNRDERPQLTLLNRSIKSGSELAKNVSENLNKMEVSIPIPLPGGFTTQVPLFNRKTAELDRFRKSLVSMAAELATVETKIYELTNEENTNEEETKERIKLLQRESIQLQNKLDIEQQIFYSYLGYDQLIIRDETIVSYVTTASVRPMFLKMEGEATVQNLFTHPPEDTDERAELKGSLPIGAGLQQGNTDVWTIRLGTRGGLWFVPSQYNLQFNVIYALSHDKHDDNNAIDIPLYVNTVSKSLNVRTSMLSLMTGAFLGGIAGAIARELQIGNSEIQSIGLKAGLSAILSVAAVIFAARKADTQSFISVEDFWGGAVVGFIVGFSGTVAFEQITEVQ